jgi:uncharacterized membrane protein YeaQ/YmgE (transglycosylase-associated protein family)
MRKTLIMAGMTIGSLLGGWIPSLFGVSSFSFLSFFISSMGALAGIFIAFKLTDGMD